MENDDKKYMQIVYADGCMYCVSDTGEEFRRFIGRDDSCPVYPVNC